MKTVDTSNQGSRAAANVSEASTETMVMGDWKRYIGNGEVINNFLVSVQVWSDDRGVYRIPAGGRSEAWGEDVDHVRDGRGGWWKIGWNVATVDSLGNVHDAECRTSTFGVACPQEEIEDNSGTGGEEASDAGVPLPGGVQPKLEVNQPNDRFEQEADAVAEKVVSGGEAIQRKCAACEEEEKIQRQPEEEEELQMKPLLQMKTSSLHSETRTSPWIELQIQNQRGSGQNLPDHTRSFMESGVGANFQNVKVHTDSTSVQMNRELGARAFTVGNDIFFNSNQYSPETGEGKKLLAHELTHTVQQGAATKLQPKLGDGHDLTSPRFSKIMDLEESYDDEKFVKTGSKGRGVQAIQQSLYDLGFALPKYGADGEFGSETKAALKDFQRKQKPPLVDDGVVGPITMTALDKRFPAVKLPAKSVLHGKWTPSCVQSVLCPWSPHTIDVLKNLITLKSYDKISWADEKWDGTAWVPAPFPGGGYNTGTVIGILNKDCETVSETLYHEVLHAEQPTEHSTTLENESYAYRIGEEFSIAMGLSGRPGLRSTDAQGREFADSKKVDAFVSAKYPSVGAGGKGEQIIAKTTPKGHVEVKKSNGTIYTRPAVIGEKVPGPRQVVNEKKHKTSTWSCP